MCLRYASNAVGNRLSNQFMTLAPSGALGEISLNSAMSASYAFLSSPINSLLSARNMYGGTSRLSGAGLFLYTRPARSNVEPWQGQKKPPGQLSGSAGWAPVWNLSTGEQPKCVQMPMTTKTSEWSWRERSALRAYSG